MRTKGVVTKECGLRDSGAPLGGRAEKRMCNIVTVTAGFEKLPPLAQWG